MTRDYVLYETIDRVPLNEWQEVCQGSPACFMDPKFLRAIERTQPEGSCVYHAVIYDENSKPAACASLCLFPIDLLMLAGQGVRNSVGWLRKLFPKFGQTKILMCGLPFSAGQSHLVFAAGADRTRALGLLDTLMRQLARREGARALVFKEFGEAERPDMDSLTQRGYWRADSPPMYELAKRFDSFAAYREALKAHYRTNVRRSQRRFEEAGCRFVIHADAGEIERVYTPRVHALYEAVVGKSDLKLETLSRDFFLELVRQLPGQVTLTAVYREDQIVGFTWDLAGGREYHFLFLGLDYNQNTEADLYFNLVYQAMDTAFQGGAEIIHVGQTADAFKSLLGCSGKPLYLYARGVGLVLSWVLRKCAGLLFPPRVPVPGHDVFKTEVEAPTESKRKQKAEAKKAERKKQKQEAILTSEAAQVDCVI